MREIVAKHLPQTSATIDFDDGYPPMAPTAGQPPAARALRPGEPRPRLRPGGRRRSVARRRGRRLVRRREGADDHRRDRTLRPRRSHGEGDRRPSHARPTDQARRAAHASPERRLGAPVARPGAAEPGSARTLCPLLAAGRFLAQNQSGRPAVAVHPSTCPPVHLPSWTQRDGHFARFGYTGRVRARPVGHSPSSPPPPPEARMSLTIRRNAITAAAALALAIPLGAQIIVAPAKGIAQKLNKGFGAAAAGLDSPTQGSSAKKAPAKTRSDRCGHRWKGERLHDRPVPVAGVAARTGRGAQGRPDRVRRVRARNAQHLHGRGAGLQGRAHHQVPRRRRRRRELGASLRRRHDRRSSCAASGQNRVGWVANPSHDPERTGSIGLGGEDRRHRRLAVGVDREHRDRRPEVEAAVAAARRRSRPTASTSCSRATDSSIAPRRRGPSRRRWTRPACRSSRSGGARATRCGRRTATRSRS